MGIFQFSDEIFRDCKQAELLLVLSDSGAAVPASLHVLPASHSVHDFSSFVSGSNGNTLVVLKRLQHLLEKQLFPKLKQLQFQVVSLSHLSFDMR
jgi:hypothetical protein